MFQSSSFIMCFAQIGRGQGRGRFLKKIFGENFTKKQNIADHIEKLIHNINYLIAYFSPLIRLEMLLKTYILTKT